VSVEENKTLVRREQQELWNHTGELDAADELFAADQAEAAKRQAAHFWAEAVGAQEREARLRRVLVQVLHTPLELAIADHADLSTRYSP